VEERPPFDQLAELDKLGLKHAWDVADGRRDLGSLALVTPDRVVEAARLVRSGAVVNLALPLTEPDPPFYGRKPLEHTVFMLDRNNADDRLDNFFPQASSQWDGLRHVRAREFGYFGGIAEDPEPGAGPLGIEHWVEHGMVGRGVLLDVAAHLERGGEPLDPFEPRALGPDVLEATAAEQGVELRGGDFLCVRLGWTGAYLRLDRAGREEVAAQQPLVFAGLEGSEAMARFLWDSGAAAIACDNPAIEVSPGDPAVGSLHRRVLPLLGMALGELFVLDRLAALCASERRWEFLFVAVPLNVPGGVGSPANAIAVL
jgi:kynurenine formamidase